MKRIPMVLIILLLAVAGFTIEIDEAQYNLGDSLFNQKKYAESVKELDGLIKRYPASVYYKKALYLAAKASYSIKDYNNAVSYYSLLSEANPNSVEKRQAAYGLAECAYQNSEWEKAAADYLDFALKYPDSPVAAAALNYSGRAAEKLELFQDAAGIYTRLSDQYPKSPYAVYALERLSALKTQKPKEKITEAETKTKAPDIDLSIEPDYNTEVTQAPEPGQITNIITLYITNTVNPRTGNEDNSFQAYKPVTNNIETERIITNFIVFTNTQVKSQFPEILISNHITNMLQISNLLENQAVEPDTNILLLEQARVEFEKNQKEVNRYRALVELKAKLLEMKERAIQDKNNLITNTNLGIAP